MSKENDRDTERWGKIKKAIFGEDIKHNSIFLLEFFSALMTTFQQYGKFCSNEDLKDRISSVLVKTQFQNISFQEYTQAFHGLFIFANSDLESILLRVSKIIQLTGGHYDHAQKLCQQNCTAIFAGYILALFKLIEDVYWWEKSRQNFFVGQFAEIISYSIRHGGQYATEGTEPMETHSKQIIDVKKFQGQVSQQLKTHLSGINQDYTKALLENALRSLGFSLEVFPPEGLGMIIFQEMIYAYIGVLSPHQIQQKLF